jgi:hypothetical protein
MSWPARSTSVGNPKEHLLAQCIELLVLKVSAA